MRRAAALVCLSLAWLLAGCNLPFARAEQAAVPPPQLDGSTYRMVAHDGQALGKDTRYLLSFSAGRLGGNVCNRFGGDYQLQDGNLQVARLVSTRMFCADKTQMAVENALLSALRQGVTLQRQAHRLQLLDAGGKVLFSYQLFMD